MTLCPEPGSYVRIARYTPELWEAFSGLGKIHRQLLGRIGVASGYHADLDVIEIQGAFPPGNAWTGTTWVTECEEVEPATEDEWLEQQLLDEIQK